MNRSSGYTPLTYDTTPGDTDTTPLPATPVKLIYKAIYRIGDSQTGQWSAETAITVGAEILFVRSPALRASCSPNKDALKISDFHEKKGIAKGYLYSLDLPNTRSHEPPPTQAPMIKNPFLLLIFVGSAGLGWFGHQRVSATNLQPTTQPSQPRHLERKSSPKRAQDTHEKKMRGFARQIPLLDNNEQETFCENLAPQDRGTLIEAMLKETSPSGFKFEQYRLLHQVLSRWVTEDPQGAWAWCQHLTPEASRRFMTGQVLDELGKQDLNEALAMHLKLHAIDPKFKSDVPRHALEATTTKSALDFLEVLNKIPLDGEGTTDFEFAKDFDFQQAADGVTALLAKQHALPDEFPMNFIKSWAERDPDAAFAWTKPENQRGGNQFQYLLEGIEKQGIPGAASAWVARKIEESEESRRLIINGMFDGSGANIAGVLKALPDSQSADRFLTELFAEQTREFSQDFSTTLPAMSSPQVRLEALAQAKKNGVDLAKLIPQSEYQTWGITKQQFEAIFPPTAGN